MGYRNSKRNEKFEKGRSKSKAESQEPFGRRDALETYLHSDSTFRQALLSFRKANSDLHFVWQPLRIGSIASKIYLGCDGWIRDIMLENRLNI